MTRWPTEFAGFLRPPNRRPRHVVSPSSTSRGPANGGPGIPPAGHGAGRPLRSGPPMSLCCPTPRRYHHWHEWQRLIASMLCRLRIVPQARRSTHRRGTAHQSVCRRPSWLAKWAGRPTSRPGRSQNGNAARRSRLAEPRAPRRRARPRDRRLFPRRRRRRRGRRLARGRLGPDGRRRVRRRSGQVRSACR